MSIIGNHMTNDEILLEIGTRLRVRRLERNITIEDEAQATGLNRKTIIDAEGGRNIRISTLIKILRMMNMLGTLEAALPDTLPGGEAFSSRGQVRQRAFGSKRGTAKRRQTKTLLTEKE